MQEKSEGDEALIVELAERLRVLVGLKAAGRVELEYDATGRLRSHWIHEKRVVDRGSGRGPGTRLHSG
jgi:hypothetical protein